MSKETFPKDVEELYNKVVSVDYQEELRLKGLKEYLHKREYRREYRSRPEVKERLKEQEREYHSRPEVKERMKEWQREYYLKHKKVKNNGKHKLCRT